MRRLPLIPTIIVAAATLVLVGLGIWQLQRMGVKAEQIAQYRTASKLPPVAWPAVPPGDDSLLYRRASGFCLEPVAWRSAAGRNLSGDTGWSHIASCRTGAEGPGMRVDAGWSTSSAPPAGWTGGRVTGVIAPDRDHRIRLVADNPAPGLQPSAPPSPELTPNNHLLYALQWFFFAAAAPIIYLLALRRRQMKESPPKADAGA